MSLALHSTNSVISSRSLIRRVASLLRWLLVLLLVADIVSAPLHRHHHDSGVDGAAMHGHGATAAPAVPHIEEDSHLASVFHAAITLRAEPRASAPDQPTERHAQGVPLAASWALPWPPAQISVSAPYTEPDAPPHRLHRSLPPAGRAPPVRA